MKKLIFTIFSMTCLVSAQLNSAEFSAILSNDNLSTVTCSFPAKPYVYSTKNAVGAVAQKNNTIFMILTQNNNIDRAENNLIMKELYKHCTANKNMLPKINHHAAPRMRIIPKEISAHKLPSFANAGQLIKMTVQGKQFCKGVQYIHNDQMILLLIFGTHTQKQFQTVVRSINVKN